MYQKVVRNSCIKESPNRISYQGWKWRTEEITAPRDPDDGENCWQGGSTTPRTCGLRMEGNYRWWWENPRNKGTRHKTGGNGGELQGGLSKGYRWFLVVGNLRSRSTWLKVVHAPILERQHWREDQHVAAYWWLVAGVVPSIMEIFIILWAYVGNYELKICGRFDLVLWMGHCNMVWWSKLEDRICIVNIVKFRIIS